MENTSKPGQAVNSTEPANRIRMRALFPIVFKGAVYRNKTSGVYLRITDILRANEYIVKEYSKESTVNIDTGEITGNFLRSATLHKAKLLDMESIFSRAAIDLSKYKQSTVELPRYYEGLYVRDLRSK